MILRRLKCDVLNGRQGKKTFQKESGKSVQVKSSPTASKREALAGPKIHYPNMPNLDVLQIDSLPQCPSKME